MAYEGVVIMSKKLDVLVADCSGNITIMVLTPVNRSDYKVVAQALLDNEAMGGEQVAFVVPGGPADKMEMCGLEFCGNASRAFALYTAASTNRLDEGYGEVSVSVSGCDVPLAARVHDAEVVPDSMACDAVVEMDMPVPVGARELTGAELGISKGGLLVDMDGISHLILTDVAPSAALFDDIKHRIYEEIDPDMPAFGIMFCDTVNELMTPVVYVRDVDSTYFEGSCASGSVAASYALAKDAADGIHRYTLQQPEGALYTSVVKEKGRIEGISLKGLVTLSDIVSVEV